MIIATKLLFFTGKSSFVCFLKQHALIVIMFYILMIEKIFWRFEEKFILTRNLSSVFFVLSCNKFLILFNAIKPNKKQFQFVNQSAHGWSSI